MQTTLTVQFCVVAREYLVIILAAGYIAVAFALQSCPELLLSHLLTWWCSETVWSALHALLAVDMGTAGAVAHD